MSKFRKINDLKKLKLKSIKIKKLILKMLNNAGSGHSAGAIGMSEIMTYLYFKELNHFPKDPKNENRDYFLLSNGHTCPVLYAVLSETGYFPKEELNTLRKINSKLQGHPHLGSVPGIENTSGPLGQGISQAVGIAASLKRDGKKNRVYCYVGDGELEEGQCWEAILFAKKEKLNNLILIVDWNHIQIDGDPEKIMSFDKIPEKFRAFGWVPIIFNGNKMEEIDHVFKEIEILRKSIEKPICLLAKTISGYGVKYMEGKYQWHGKVPNDKELEIALSDLEELEKKIENEK